MGGRGGGGGGGRMGGGGDIRINPYPANILKMLSAFYVCCIYSGALHAKNVYGRIFH